MIMKFLSRSFLLSLGIALSVFLPGFALAQEAPTETPPPEPTPLVAVAGPDTAVVAGRTIRLDATGSTKATDPQDTSIAYEWEFGDGNKDSGFEVNHIYKESGRYDVTLTVTRTINGTKEEQTDSLEILVQDQLALLIVDQSVTLEQIAQVKNYGATQGTLVTVIRSAGAPQEYAMVQELAQELLKAEADVRAANIIITWTSGNTGINTFIELARILAINGATSDQYNFEDKAIVSISDNQPISTSARLAQNVFQGLTPSFIVVADSSVVNTAVKAESALELQDALRYSDSNYQIITPYTARGLNNLSPLNFLSYTMNYMANNGVPVNSLYLILMLPVLATIVAATRQLVGIKAFGIFVPTVLALSFLGTGLKYGVTIFLSLVVLGSIARLLVRKIKIMYLPRMAIVLSLLAFSIFGMFFIGTFLDKTGFIAVSVFPILIMTVITEHFVTSQVEQGWKSAFKLTAETLVLSLIGYFIADWTWFKSVILAFPELILLTFVLNYFIGKFTGLRLTEYIRFRNIFKHIRNAEKSQ
jgi:PKD repeat protein